MQDAYKVKSDFWWQWITSTTKVLVTRHCSPPWPSATSILFRNSTAYLLLLMCEFFYEWSGTEISIDKWGVSMFSRMNVIDFKYLLGFVRTHFITVPFLKKYLMVLNIAKLCFCFGPRWLTSCATLGTSNTGAVIQFFSHSLTVQGRTAMSILPNYPLTEVGVQL